MSPDLDADPGPSGLAGSGAGLWHSEACAEADLSAPLEALPPQPFSLRDEVRLHPARSLGGALATGLVIGLAAGLVLGGLRRGTAAA